MFVVWDIIEMKEMFKTQIELNCMKKRHFYNIQWKTGDHLLKFIIRTKKL